MASASLHTPALPRKRRPSPELILRTYRQECIVGGDRGAANRAAVLLGISDDTVRRVVSRDEAARKAREETPQELQFTPPDPAYEAERDIINRTHAAEIAARLSPDVRQSYVKNERESGENVAETPHDDAAECRTVELGNTPPEVAADAAPRSSDELDPQGDDVPLIFGDPEPTEHPRPVPVPPGPPEPEPLPDPEPSPVPTPPLVQRVIVRVPKQRQVGGLVGWLADGPMVGPLPVWALLLLAFGALLVQLGVLG